MSNISHLPHMGDPLEIIPLSIYARYHRIKLLADFNVGKNMTTPPWQSGVYSAKESKPDLLTFTRFDSLGKPSKY